MFKDKSNDPTEPTALQVYLAGQAYEVLHNWDLIPGTQAGGTVDEAELKTWCDETRRLAEERGISTGAIVSLVKCSPAPLKSKTGRGQRPP